MEKHLKMVYQIAWSFQRTTGLDFEDLAGEAALAAVAAKESYDPKKGAMSTYLYHCIKSHLKNYVKAQRKHTFGRLVSSEDYDPVNSCSIEELTNDFKFEMEAELSPPAQKIAEEIFKNSDKFLDSRPKIARGRVVRHLRDLNWKWQSIWDGMKELKNFVTA